MEWVANDPGEHQLMSSANPSVVEEMCDCGEPQCEFTKEEAEEFAASVEEYREALFSSKQSHELNEIQQYIRRDLRFAKPPWMDSEEYSRLLQKNKRDGVTRNTTSEKADQIADQIAKQFGL
jgi:hypothetical protein